MEKFPFLVYTGKFTAAIVLLFALFTAWVGWELLQAAQAAKQSLQNRTVTQNKADAPVVPPEIRYQLYERQAADAATA
jgi:hypothetical protein